MNPRHELAEVRRHLDDLLERARLADARSGREHATGGDDEGVVTAVVNGHGELVGLHIDKGARMASRRLGAQLATAVQRARQSALGKAEEDRRSMFPELPPDEEIERIFEAPTWVSDFHHIDYRGSALVRDAIAESIESFGALQEYVTELTRSRVRQEIGVGAGTVDIDATGTDLIIEIERDAPRNLGPERLAEQTLAAIRSAMAEAERRRGDVTRRLRSPGSRRMVHEHTMEW